MGHLVELGADGRVDVRMPMAMHIAPQAADRVEIAAAVDIENVTTFAALRISGSYSAICVKACQTSVRSQWRS